jgi:hypothetical protein
MKEAKAGGNSDNEDLWIRDENKLNTECRILNECSSGISVIINVDGLILVLAMVRSLWWQGGEPGLDVEQLLMQGEKFEAMVECPTPRFRPKNRSSWLVGPYWSGI